MVKHELGDSAYRTRVAECAAAARALGVASLRDATLDQLSQLDGILLKRARHVITENARVEAFAAAATSEEMGRLLAESHASLRDDYEVSCPEIDFLVETASSVPGVLGARVTGGGFGGSTVNLVRLEALENLYSTVVGAYRAKWGLTLEIHSCTPSAGASQIF
jgi:galactokinase